MLLKNRFKIFISVFVLIVTLFINSCDVRPTTMGYQHRIYVVADSTLWEEVADQVNDTFESLVYTPHSENSFFLKRIPLAKLNEYNSRMNLFFIGVDNEGGEVNEYMRKILPEEIKDGVKNNTIFHVFNDDLFARDQISLIMYAKDRQTFKQNFESAKEEIFSTFQKKYYSRLKESMYEQGENEDITQYMIDNYGFKIRVQHDYMIANQDKEKHYIWLRRYDPDRWISIWKMPGDSSMLDEKSIISIRNKSVKEFYGGDVVVEEDSYISDVDLNGSRTKKIVGLWRNDSLMVGGPFRLYTVHDPDDEMLYFVDIAVMAPGKLKKPFLDQLEVIASTFEIVKTQN